MSFAFNTNPSPQAIDEFADRANALPLGIGSSVFDSFKMGFEEPLQGLDLLTSKATGNPVDSSYATTLQALQINQNRTPDGVTKSVGDFIGNAAGTILSPPALAVTLATLGVGGAVLGGAASVASDALTVATPEIIGEGAATAAGEGAGTILGKTVPQIAETIGKSVGATEGSQVLSNVAEAYNPQTGQINQQQFLSATKANLGFGVAFGVGDLALGALFSKGRSAEIETGESMSMTDDNKPAPDESIYSPEENEFLQAHANGAPQEELTDRAHSILNSRGIDTDPVTDTVNVPLLTPTDIDNIGKTFPYETLSQLGLEKVNSSISDYIVKNALDRYRNNDALIDAIQGHLDLQQYKSNVLSKSFREDNIVSESSLTESKYKNKKIDNASLGNFKIKVPKPTADEMKSFRTKAVNGESLSTPEMLRLKSLAEKNIYGAKSILNKVNEYLQLKQANDESLIARAMIAYAESSLRSAQSDVIDQLKRMLDERALGAEREHIAAQDMYKKMRSSIEVSEPIKALGEDDLTKVANDVPKEQRVFTDDVKTNVRNFKKVSAGRELFDQFISCVMGAK